MNLNELKEGLEIYNPDHLDEKAIGISGEVDKIIDKISFAITLRIRGYEIDIECGYNKNHCVSCIGALKQFQRKLSDFKFIEDYIEGKQKYMTDYEKKKYIEEYK